MKMKITEHKIKISKLIKNYKDCKDEGVTAYGGKLNVRPPYQREFIYDPPEQKAVINSILNDFPLNVMY